LSEFPYQKEGISNVLIGTSKVLVRDAMTDCSNLIYEDHYICFQDFRCIREISDIAEPKQSHDFLSRDHDIYDGGILDNSANDLSASLTESYG
jgi:hypothetical protein